MSGCCNHQKETMKTTLTMQAETIEEEQHLKDVLSVYEYKRALNDILDAIRAKDKYADEGAITWNAVRGLILTVISDRGIVL